MCNVLHAAAIGIVSHAAAIGNRSYDTATYVAVSYDLLPIAAAATGSGSRIAAIRNISDVAAIDYMLLQSAMHLILFLH